MMKQKAAQVYTKDKSQDNSFSCGFWVVPEIAEKNPSLIQVFIFESLVYLVERRPV